MSSDLTWEPARRKKQSLPTALKFALRKRFGEPVNSTLSAGHIDYLMGLAHADVAGATELLEAIQKHGEVVVREEY